MAFADFTQPNPLANGVSWTARFHSFNQRKLDVYYIITLYRQEKAYKTFGARVNSYDDIAAALARVAHSGRTNIPPGVLWRGVAASSETNR